MEGMNNGWGIGVGLGLNYWHCNSCCYRTDFYESQKKVNY